MIPVIEISIEDLIKILDKAHPEQQGAKCYKIQGSIEQNALCLSIFEKILTLEFDSE